MAIRGPFGAPPVILPKSCLRKQTYIFVFSLTQKIDHIPWPTARAQLCETTQMLRASLQPRTQMIVAPCVHQTPLQAQACQLQAPQARSRISRGLEQFGAQMPPGSTYQMEVPPMCLLGYLGLPRRSTESADVILRHLLFASVDFHSEPLAIRGNCGTNF